MNMQKLHKLAVFCTVVINIPIIFGDINDNGLNEILNHNKQKLNCFRYNILRKHGFDKISNDNFDEAKNLFVQYLTKKEITITSSIPSVEETSHRSYKCVNYFWGCSDGKKYGIRFFYNGTIHLGEFTADKSQKNTLWKKFMPKIIDCIDGWRYNPKKKDIWDKIKKQSLLNKASQTMNTAHKSFTEHSKKMVSNTLSGVNRLVNNGTNMVSNTLSVVNNGINDIYNKTNRVLNTANTLIKAVNGVYEGFNSVQETNDTNNNTGNNEILNEEHQNQNQNTGSNQRYNNERHDVTTKKKCIILGQLIRGAKNAIDNEKVIEATSNLVRTYNNTFGDLSAEERINSITTGMKIYGICCRCKW